MANQLCCRAAFAGLMGCLRQRRLRRVLGVLLAVVIVAAVWTASLRREATPQQQQQPEENEDRQEPQRTAQPANLLDRPPPWDVKRSSQLLIPKRLHHYFSTADAIPARLVHEINSWAGNHKDFDVFYWDSGYVERNLLSRPEYQRYHRYYWNGTQSRYERDLIARLLILHHSGGVMVDLNMRSLRQATDYLADTTCVVAQDRVEKAVFAYGFEALPSLAFVACKPRHHFITYFLRKVTEIEFRTGAVVLAVETATFLAHVFNAAVAAFDDECTRTYCDFRDRVTLAEPQVFLPVMEAGMFGSFVDNCMSRGKMAFLQKEACYNLDMNGNQPTVASLAMPIYVDTWAPTKDRPLLPMMKIGPSAGRTPTRNWSLR